MPGISTQQHSQNNSQFILRNPINTGGIPSSQPSYPVRDKMGCSLDFLAHIAQFQSRQDSEVQAQTTANAAHAVTNATSGCTVSSYQQLPQNSNIANKLGNNVILNLPGLTPVIQLPMGALPIPLNGQLSGSSTEMFSDHSIIADHGSGPKAPIIKPENPKPQVTEGPKLRRKRLNQNHMYRQLLREKGIYPIRNGASEYRCSRCGEAFPKEMFMWRHGVKHLNHKPFKCDICDAPFNRSDSLGRHVRHFHRGGK